MVKVSSWDTRWRDAAHCACSGARYHLRPFHLKGLYGSLVCKMIWGLYYKPNHLQRGIKVDCFWHFFFFFSLAVLHFDVFLSQLVFLLTDPKYHHGLVQRPQLASNFVLCWAFISVQLTELSSMYLCELARDGKTPLEFRWLRNYDWGRRQDFILLLLHYSWEN